jgi:hypothetical protein
LTEEGTGVIYNEDGNKVHIGAKGTYEFKSGNVTSNVALHYGGKAFGETAKAFIHTDFATKFIDNKYSEAAVLNQWWIVDGDVSAGLRWEHAIGKAVTAPSALRLEG